MINKLVIISPFYLNYNTFRYFDPKIGRFTQLDPIGLNGGFNLYEYAPNTFVWIDPLGLKVTKISPKTVLYSQDSIGSVFNDGRSVEDLVEQLKKNPELIDQLPPIRKVKMQKLPTDTQEILGKQGVHKDAVISIDNRRLYSAKKAKVKKIQSVWATDADLAEVLRKGRFSTDSGGKKMRVRKGKKKC